MPSTESRFSAEQRRALIDLARASIRHGLDHGRPLPVDPQSFDPDLREPGAAFVTLHRDAALRGCIGSLEPRQPLVEEISHNAYAAAFRDPRFPPLTRGEYPDLEVSISVLGPSEPLEFSHEADLLRQLRPGIDGLILEEDGRRGTFLPTVWASLPEPADFLAELKRKAGLPADYWSDRLRISRYTTESFG
ncbi:hypothetical protein TspCOW1_11250 [Thiohalobacter sp. COW1]|uniref:AmmeMemoRadiSam system protein A n=1 Tax=Thiohalobacter sp. COW1 TaxID=2795687 RepID=UPI001914FFBA|nr:AmmeMemoRadiSam system protein A [Thiohalobacter sp. COW1]BCO31022.1 hypothetical protein TspCOW1_11250 [Thiohalobacter sp. COW1]